MARSIIGIYGNNEAVFPSSYMAARNIMEGLVNMLLAVMYRVSCGIKILSTATWVTTKSTVARILKNTNIQVLISNSYYEAGV